MPGETRSVRLISAECLRGDFPRPPISGAARRRSDPEQAERPNRVAVETWSFHTQASQ